jgi:hypothetical protein
MGNSAPGTSFSQKKHDDMLKSQQRHLQYRKSALGNLCRMTDSPQTFLKPGDILVGPYVKNVSNGVEDRLYSIYAEYLGNDKHRLIEKSFQIQENGNPIVSRKESSDLLLRNYELVLDSRYPDTLEVAEFMQKHHLDAGHSGSLANFESFAVFCLTRNTQFTKNRESSTISAIRDGSASVSVPVANTVKLASHLVYYFSGDMSLDERMVKTAVPFGFDSEAIATGKQLLIGCSNRKIWHYRFQFDKQPSFNTLHQNEVDDPTDDKRIMKYHRR